jgi:hypothetical protein
MHTIFKAILIFQLCALLIALFVPFGFDHPSDLGLDYGHFLLLLGIYSALLLSGIVLSVRAKNLTVLVIQILVPLTVAFLAIGGFLRT